MCHKKLHSELAEAIEQAKVRHRPVAEGKCTACHTPHSTDYEKQLQAPLKEICFGCHEELGYTVAESAGKHGPVNTNDCAQCHLVHGSPYSRLLRAYFPAEFYTPYATEKYRICFNCHNSRIALRKMSEETEFRNGRSNLHFLHVNREKGRSCKACHGVHAGNQEKHIREEVPFGRGWSYPITYKKTATGGSCVVGCHKPKKYDREIPVRYD